MNVSLWLSSDCFSFPCHKMSCLSLRFVCSFFSSSSSGKLRVLLQNTQSNLINRTALTWCSRFSFIMIGSAVRVVHFKPLDGTQISKYYGDFHPSVLNCSHTGAVASWSSLRTPIAVHAFAVKETLTSKKKGIFWHLTWYLYRYFLPIHNKSALLC